MMLNDRVTPHFKYNEYACKGNNCCGFSVPINPILTDAVERLRVLIGKPIVISSGFRCRVHNKQIGGSAGSFHALGMAVDISVKSMTPEKLKCFALKIPEFKNGGIGIYGTFIHVDIRGCKARWDGRI